jgi:hypothetical protein
MYSGEASFSACFSRPLGVIREITAVGIITITASLLPLRILRVGSRRSVIAHSRGFITSTLILLPIGTIASVPIIVCIHNNS